MTAVARDLMNALTGSDWTMYLFSTRNAKDSELLDSVPGCDLLPSCQRTRSSKRGSASSSRTADEQRLRYKGVVFNEMKAALATPGAAVDRASARRCPGLPYAYVSGGDPQDIPNLTWDHLKQFHARHYTEQRPLLHLRQSSLETTLETIERSALSRFQRIEVDSSIPDVKRFAKTNRGLEPYPAWLAKTTSQGGGLDRMGHVPSADSFRALAMKVLSEVLLSNAGSPLRKALIDSGLAARSPTGSGFHDDYKEAGLRRRLEGSPPRIGIGAAGCPRTLDRVAIEVSTLSQVDAAMPPPGVREARRSNAFAVRARIPLRSCPLPVWRRSLGSMDFDADLELSNRRAQKGVSSKPHPRELLDNQHRALLTSCPTRARGAPAPG